MATERFPKAKYLRQLTQMRDDLYSWSQAYAQAAEHTTPEWLQGRFLDRAAVLEDAAYRVQKAREMLEGVPRLS